MAKTSGSGRNVKSLGQRRCELERKRSNKPPVLYLTMFHHKHGTSSMLITVPVGMDFEKRAAELWKEIDGYDKDNEEESIEVYAVGQPEGEKGWEIRLVKVR